MARRDGIPDGWVEAAKNSPVYKLAVEWKLALPLRLAGRGYRHRPFGSGSDGIGHCGPGMVDGTPYGDVS